MKALFQKTLADKEWWVGTLQLAIGIYLALMALVITLYLAATLLNFLRN